ncbi:hypothetical protein F2P81_024461 [Scophthalmus maximus]|uniref:Uncharacterized protein n=1 Tax=Scophthalmus maximus TaxID=52904 RepID=A0A6A4RXN6_SCOMX|nr:hypothetical protein F2P81_024461 [Scophthalmus maximus]
MYCCIIYSFAVLQSQLDFSLTSGAADQGISVSQAESKSAKAPHSNQIGTKGRRPEEESSFWKISAERSRLEGEQADFQSLTPSQIKSLEKGEKPLPSYLRQETSVTSKEPEAAESLPPAPVKPPKQRAPRPPIINPPAQPTAQPTAVSATPASISITPNPPPPVRVSSTSAGWERSQSTLPSVGSTVDEVFSSGMMSKPAIMMSKPPNMKLKTPNIPAGVAKEREDGGSPNPDGNPTFCQFNTSNNVLKTGFDFLDNCFDAFSGNQIDAYLAMKNTRNKGGSKAMEVLKLCHGKPRGLNVRAAMGTCYTCPVWN